MADCWSFIDGYERAMAIAHQQDIAEKEVQDSSCREFGGVPQL
jgi:hypothetical protein